MSLQTNNLQLYKADPLTDGNKTFNINTMLNDNWDKVDENAGELSNKIGILNNLTTTEKSNLVGAISEVNTSLSNVMLLGTSNPTTSTVGALGQLYKNTTTGKIYQCTAIVSTAYTWLELTTTETYTMQASDMRNGWKIPEWSKLIVTRVGNLVNIHGEIFDGAIIDNASLFFIPLGFRPKELTRFKTSDWSNNVNTQYEFFSYTDGNTILTNTIPWTAIVKQIDMTYTI